MPSEAVNALDYSGHYDGERLVEAVDSLGSGLRPCVGRADERKTLDGDRRTDCA